jgi:hypothetical protein
MPCLVQLYEVTATSPAVHLALTATTIDLVAVDEATRANCCKVVSNGALGGGGFGGNLVFATASIVYQVAIVDSAMIYAGVTLPHLSGTVNGSLDVVLHKLPAAAKGSAGSTGTSAAQIRADVLAFPLWNDEEKQAVLSTMSALIAVRGSNAPALRQFIQTYEITLSARGIDPVFL